MFTFLEDVNFLAWVFHIVVSDCFCLIFDVRLPITIVEMLLMSNRILKLLNIALLLRVFIQTFSIGK